MTAALIAQAQRTVLDHCIKALSTLQAQALLDNGEPVTVAECIRTLCCLRIDYPANQTTAADLWQHIDKLQGDVAFARQQALIAIAHSERIMREHAEMLELLERCVLVLSPEREDRETASEYYAKYGEYAKPTPYACRDEALALINLVLTPPPVASAANAASLPTAVSA